jgi:hypothetical protein
MCMNCVSHADVVAGNVAALIGATSMAVRLGEPAEVRAARRLAGEARTVAFLRRLDLDPVEILGADVVTHAADRRAVAAAEELVRARRAQIGFGLRLLAGAIRSHRAFAPR